MDTVAFLFADMAYAAQQGRRGRKGGEGGSGERLVGKILHIRVKSRKTFYRRGVGKQSRLHLRELHALTFEQPEELHVALHAVGSYPFDENLAGKEQRKREKVTGPRNVCLDFIPRRRIERGEYGNGIAFAFAAPSEIA